MKKIIQLTKEEQKLEWFLIFIAILSFCVIALGVYFQNSNINKDYLLVPVLLGIYIIFFGIHIYNGIRGGNLLKKWASIFMYDIIFWIVSKNNTYRQKAEKITNKIILIIAILLCGLFLLLMIISLIKIMI